MPPVDTLNPEHLIIKSYSLYFSSSQHLYLSHSKNTKCGVKIRTTPVKFPSYSQARG